MKTIALTLVLLAISLTAPSCELWKPTPKDWQSVRIQCGGVNSNKVIYQNASDTSTKSVAIEVTTACQSTGELRIVNGKGETVKKTTIPSPGVQSYQYDVPPRGFVIVDCGKRFHEGHHCTIKWRVNN